MPDIPEEIAAQLRDRLAAGDLGWIESSYRSGKLDSLKGLLSAGDWTELPKRIAAKDLAWIRNVLGASGRAMSGRAVVGTAAGGLGLVALASKLKGFMSGKFDWDWLGKAHKSGDLDALKPHVKTAEWDEFGRRIADRDESWFRRVFGGLDLPGVGKLGALGAAGVAAGAATTRKRRGIWWWLIPAIIVIGLLAWLLSRCGNDDKTTSTTTAVASTVVPGTTVAPATTAAPTTAAPTTAAPTTTTTAAPATTAATATTTAVPALQSLLDTAGRAGNFSTFAKLVGDAGLGDILNGAGPYTVFAPTDEAFKKLSPAALEALGADKEALKALLSSHVTAGNLKSADLKAGPLKSLTSNDIVLAIAGGKISLNSGRANVITADIAAKNGVLHAIDNVLLLPVPTPLPTVE